MRAREFDARDGGGTPQERMELMKFGKRDGWMVAGGFVLGTLGVKALTSNAAKKCYVQGVAKSLQAKAAYQDVVEQAKAQVDDIVAEANYINESAKADQPEAAAE